MHLAHQWSIRPGPLAASRAYTTPNLLHAEHAPHQACVTPNIDFLLRKVKVIARLSIMENNKHSEAGGYSADEALRDAAQARSLAQQAQNVPLPPFVIALLATVLPLASFGSVIASPWKYAFLVAALLVAGGTVAYSAKIMDKHGVRPLILDELSRQPRILITLVLSALVYVATLPLTDIFRWNPWIIPVVGCSVSALWVFLLVSLNRQANSGAK